MRAIGYALVAGVTLIAVVTLVRLHIEGGELFVAGRLDSPVGYRNATAALFALAFWPLIGLAVTRGRNPTLRATAFACPVLCLGLGFLTQSRGVIVGLAAGGWWRSCSAPSGSGARSSRCWGSPACWCSRGPC